MVTLLNVVAKQVLHLREPYGDGRPRGETALDEIALGSNQPEVKTAHEAKPPWDETALG